MPASRVILNASGTSPTAFGKRLLPDDRRHVGTNSAAHSNGGVQYSSSANNGQIAQMVDTNSHDPRGERVGTCTVTTTSGSDVSYVLGAWRSYTFVATL
jgi:hypothetical protein